jgi:hypothetical protein
MDDDPAGGTFPRLTDITPTLGLALFAAAVVLLYSSQRVGARGRLKPSRGAAPRGECVKPN